MTTHELIWLLVAFTGLLLSALCSGLEIGLYTINRVRLAVRSGRGDRRAVRLDRELRDPGRSLTTLLIGNNIANYLGSLGIMALLKSSGLSDTSGFTKIRVTTSAKKTVVLSTGAHSNSERKDELDLD